MMTRPALLVLVFAACSGTAPMEDPIRMLSAEVGDPIGTVVTVSWETTEASTGYVEFGTDGAFDRSTRVESSAGTDHAARLVGLPQDTEISYRVVVGDQVGQPQTITTGTLPGGPELVVEGSGQDLFLTLPFLFPDNTQIGMVDPEGRLVWIHRAATDLAVYRSRVALDGSGIVYSATLNAGLPDPASTIVRVGWDGEEISRTAIPDLAHDFVELDDGTLVTLAYELRDDIEGNMLLSVAPDGTVTELWSTWDCFDPDTHVSDDVVPGWTHANALDYDEASDSFLVGLRNFGTIVQVKQDGTCGWSIGGVGGTMEVTGQRFTHQHQFQRLDGGGLLVFDNDGASGQVSRAIEYSLDEAADTARLERILVAEPPIYTFILGDVHRSGNGDTTIVWAVAGTVDRMAADDTRLWRLTNNDNALFGFTHFLKDPGRPELGAP